MGTPGQRNHPRYGPLISLGAAAASAGARLGYNYYGPVGSTQADANRNFATEAMARPKSQNRYRGGQVALRQLIGPRAGGRGGRLRPRRGRRVATRSRGRGGKTRTKTRSRTRKRKRSKSVKRSVNKKRKLIRRLAAPKSFFDRLSLINPHVGWDTTKISTCDTIQARVLAKRVAADRWVPVSGLGAATIVTYPGSGGTNVPMGHGNCLVPYVIAGQNSFSRTAATYNLPVGTGAAANAFTPVLGFFAGSFASRLQGSNTTTTAYDIHRNSYLQVKSYTDKYTLKNASSSEAIVRVWHVKRKLMYEALNGTYAGVGVAGAAAPTYIPGTGDFEAHLEWCALSEEYSDDSVYTAGAIPGYTTNSAPNASGSGDTNFGSPSGSLDTRAAAVWGLPMTHWKGLKPFYKIKKAGQFTIPVGGSRVLRYKHKTKTYNMCKLALDWYRHTVNSGNERGQQARKLEIYFEVIGVPAMSNDDDYQQDFGRATVSVRRDITMVHRTVVSTLPSMKFRINSVFSEDNQGFNREFRVGGEPAVSFSHPMVIGPQLAEIPGHQAVDVFMQNSNASGWKPITEGATTNALKTSA